MKRYNILSDMNYIKNILWQYRNSVDDFEDLLGTCYETYLMLLEKVDDRENIRPYIYKKINWRAIDYIRSCKSKGRGKTDEIGYTIMDNNIPHDQKVLINIIIDRLSDLDKGIVILKYWERMSNQAIANEMNITKSTVCYRYKKALEQIKKEIKRFETINVGVF